MNATSTTKSVLLTTVLTFPLIGFQPVELVKEAEFFHCSDLTQLDSPKQFESGFRIIDHKIVRNTLVEEVQVIHSLLEIGNILFKNAQDESPAELKAKRAYFKSRYSKV